MVQYFCNEVTIDRADYGLIKLSENVNDPEYPVEACEYLIVVAGLVNQR